MQLNLFSSRNQLEMASEFSVNGKVAFITGGASGIGLAILKEFLKHGLKGAAVVDIDEENGEKVLQELDPNRVIFVKTDVSKRQEVEAAFEKAAATFQNLDIVVNSAGICISNEWEKEVAVNLTGTMNSSLLGLDEYLPTYKSGDEALIINISSVGGLGVIESHPTYCATKHGIVGLSRCLGTENHYKRTKVRVLAICPGATDTPLHQKVRYVSPPYEELFHQMSSHFSSQPVEKVAEGVMEAIRKGQNGSIWVVNSGETFEVKLPELFTLLKH